MGFWQGSLVVDVLKMSPGDTWVIVHSRVCLWWEQFSRNDYLNKTRKTYLFLFYSETVKLALGLKTFYLIIFLWLFFKRKTFDISPLIAKITNRFTASKTLLWNHNFSSQEILELMDHSLQKFDIDSLLEYNNFDHKFPASLSCFFILLFKKNSSENGKSTWN